MRGGLDDALDKLARRDELRRRAAGEAPGTPPAVTELVEAVAAVVARHPELGITMGVEGAGDPVLLHFADDNGTVQVSADNSVASRIAQTPAAPRHADFDIDLDAVDDPHPVAHADVDAPAASEPLPFTGDGGSVNREPYRYDAARQYEATGSYEPTPYVAGAHQYDTPSHQYDAYGRSSDAYRSFADRNDSRDAGRRSHPRTPDPRIQDPRIQDPAASPTTASAPAAKPSQPATDQPMAAQASGRQSAAAQSAAARAAAAQQWTMPAPLPKPVPLRMEPGETELAAKRLAALLREDPSLLHPAPPD